jgi:hypothetical protein
MKTARAFLIAAILNVLPTARSEPWERHAIDPAVPSDHLAGADGVRLGDINGDGLPDIVTGWEEGKAIRICLNPGPESASEQWKAVTVGRVSSAEDAVFADLDRNGVLDVVSATEGKSRTMFVHWAPAANEILDETKWETDAFPSTRNRQWWMYTVPFDIDRDGDVDLLAGSKSAGAGITWLRNPGNDRARKLGQWEEQRLCDADWIMSLRLFERADRTFLLFSDRKGDRSGVYLMPFLDAKPWVGEPVLIGAPGEEIMFLDAAHLDDDDRLDIVAAIRPGTTRIFYQPEDPLQVWEDTADLSPLPEEPFGTTKAVRVGDLDGDEIPDFALTCERANGAKVGVLWADMFSDFHPIGDGSGIKFDRIELLDLDADGDLDLVTCEERAGLGVIWYENPLR